MNRLSIISSLPFVTALSFLTLAACSSSTGGTGGSGGADPTTTSSTSSAGGVESTTTSSTATASSSSGSAPVCGDGNVDTGETCDDGNATDGDGCTKACGKECTALHFVGASIATAANPSTLNVTSVTMAAWYKAEVGTAPGVIAGKRGNTPGGHFTYQLTAGPGGLVARLQTNVNLDFLDLTDAAKLPDGKWHHAAVTYDAATGKGELFFDGKSVVNGTKGTGLVAADPAQPFTIGALTLDGVPGAQLKADIADVVVYDKSLSSADVAGLAQGKYPAAAPLAFFLTQEGMGLTSADASGNGHTLTVPADGWVADGPFCTP